VVVRICRHCDRGNRFCLSCAPLARAEKQRTARKKYQKTNNGRLNHKVRQEKYRDRLQKNVTHHGDLEISGERKSTTATKKRAREIHYEDSKHSHQTPSRPGRCDFCGRPCWRTERPGFLARRSHANRRGPRLPLHGNSRRRRCATTVRTRLAQPGTI
jgi:hypothetical protein